MHAMNLNRSGLTFPNGQALTKSSAPARWISICFWALLTLQLFSIWVIPHFPSQDGPSHLYNAAVLARYDHVPIFREFYTVHFTAAGNILAQMIQAVLLQSAGDIAAEKVLLTLYVIVLPFSFRALLSSATRDTGAFPLM